MLILPLIMLITQWYGIEIIVFLLVCMFIIEILYCVGISRKIVWTHHRKGRAFEDSDIKVSGENV